MANTESRPLDRRGSSKAFGMLALLAAVLSIGIYAVSGHWPAGLGGGETVFFVLLGIGLFAHGWMLDG